MKPSKRLLEALHIIQDKKPMSFTAFAQEFWPDNLMHDRVTAAGNRGSRRGAGAWLSAGSYLAKLEKKGLIIKQQFFRWNAGMPVAILTAKGIEILKVANAPIHR